MLGLQLTGKSQVHRDVLWTICAYEIFYNNVDIKLCTWTLYSSEYGQYWSAKYWVISNPVDFKLIEQRVNIHKQTGENCIQGFTGREVEKL